MINGNKACNTIGVRGENERTKQRHPKCGDTCIPCFREKPFMCRILLLSLLTSVVFCLLFLALQLAVVASFLAFIHSCIPLSLIFSSSPPPLHPSSHDTHRRLHHVPSFLPPHLLRLVLPLAATATPSPLPPPPLSCTGTQRTAWRRRTARTSRSSLKPWPS